MREFVGLSVTSGTVLIVFAYHEACRGSLDLLSSWKVDAVKIWKIFFGAQNLVQDLTNALRSCVVLCLVF